MANPKTTKQGPVSTRVGIPASPDAGMNNNQIPSLQEPGITNLIQMLPAIDDVGLEFVQSSVELEADRRTPEGRGAFAFRKALRKQKKAIKAADDAAVALLEEVEGAISAFFDDRDAQVRTADVQLSGCNPTCASSFTKVRDPQIGRLNIWIRAYYNAETDSRIEHVHGTIKTMWGRALMELSGSPAEVIADFAAWAALQG